MEILAQTKTIEPTSCLERLQKQLIWGTEDISSFIYSLGSSRLINLWLILTKLYLDISHFPIFTIISSSTTSTRPESKESPPFPPQFELQMQREGQKSSGKKCVDEMQELYRECKWNEGTVQKIPVDIFACIDL